MPAIRIPERGRVLDGQPGRSLLDILAAAGLMLPSPCGAAGLCGKCVVTVAGEGLPAPTQQERSLFTGEELARGRRLACTLFPEADLDVALPQEAADSAILSDGYLPSFGLEPAWSRRPSDWSRSRAFPMRQGWRPPLGKRGSRPGCCASWTLTTTA